MFLLFPDRFLDGDAEEFTKQYPNVTWDIKQDQFTNLINSTPRLLSGDNPPDLIRLPTMVSFAEQGLLKNLDDYASAFGWNEWPVPQLNQNRVAEDGTRGSGSLYAMGLNYSLTGIFYNKELAAQIGMTEPPKTLAEFDDLLAKAKEAGLLPIMQWGSAKSGMGLAFPSVAGAGADNAGGLSDETAAEAGAVPASDRALASLLPPAVGAPVISGSAA